MNTRRIAQVCFASLLTSACGCTRHPRLAELLELPRTFPWTLDQKEEIAAAAGRAIPPGETYAIAVRRILATHPRVELIEDEPGRKWSVAFDAEHIQVRSRARHHILGGHVWIVNWWFADGRCTSADANWILFGLP